MIWKTGNAVKYKSKDISVLSLFQHPLLSTNTCIKNPVSLVILSSLANWGPVWSLGSGWMVRVSEPGRGEIFRTRTDRPWNPSPGPRRGVDHWSLSSAEVEERVELYPYSTSGNSWPVLGQTLPLLLSLANSVSLVVLLFLANSLS